MEKKRKPNQTKNKQFFCFEFHRKTSDDFFVLLGRMLLQSKSISESENAPTSSKTALPNNCILDRILNLQLLALVSRIVYFQFDGEQLTLL